MQVSGGTMKKYHFKVFGNMWTYHRAEFQSFLKKYILEISEDKVLVTPLFQEHKHATDLL